MHAIEISGLEKTYTVGFLRKKEKVALKPLNLEVTTGEVFGFLGPNGAGKTTTLKLLMGLIFPTGGSAKILNMDWREPQVKAQIVFLSTHILSDAETVCDRVAVIHKGELRGVGVTKELTSRARGTTELVWYGASAMAAITALGGDSRISGESMRAVIPEAKLDAAL